MAKRDNRVRKFKGSDDRDIFANNLFLIISLMQKGEYKGLTLQQGLTKYMEDQRDDKLLRLLHIYKIKTGDPMLAFFELSVKLAEEFVRGFRIVDMPDHMNPKHRPSKYSDNDWLSLAREIARLKADGHTLDRACSFAAKNLASFKGVDGKALAAMYRRSLKKLHEIADNEIALEQKGYGKNTVREILALASATKKRA